jgi:ribonuclease P protein component
MGKESFTKHDRLRKSKSIDSLFKKGESLSLFPFKIIYSFSETEETRNVRFSNINVVFITPKRHFKKAVERNCLKRKMREIFRKNKEMLNSFLSSNHKKIELALIFTGNQNTEYQIIENQMLAVFEFIINKFSKK